MRFEWDANKNDANIRKHGVDFIVAKEIFSGPILERTDPGFHKESRWQALGVTNDKVLLVIYTMRGEVCRIISARKANRHEANTYYQKILG